MNKKVMILIVVIECVLAILLIAVLGKAIENYHTDVEATEIFFTNEAGERLENGAVLEVARMDRGYQLHYGFAPEDVTDQSVRFTSGKPDLVTVSEEGYVSFSVDTDVVITVSSANGKTATVTLVPKSNTDGKVDWK